MSIEDSLQRIEDRLNRIEELLVTPSKAESLSREHYSVAEFAMLTEAFGVKAYARYTIRKACADGRIPEAEKMDDGKTWSIPREAVLRILDIGFPPEKRGQESED